MEKANNTGELGNVVPETRDEKFKEVELTTEKIQVKQGTRLLVDENEGFEKEKNTKKTEPQNKTIKVETNNNEKREVEKEVKKDNTYLIVIIIVVLITVFLIIKNKKENGDGDNQQRN